MCDFVWQMLRERCQIRRDDPKREAANQYSGEAGGRLRGGKFFHILKKSRERAVGVD